MRPTIGLQFAARCAEGGPLDALRDEFRRTIGLFGFVASACSAWPGAARTRATFLFLDWPSDWADLYEARCFADKDFIVTEARKRMAPLLWADVRARRKLTRGEAEFAAAIQAYGWIDILAVPLHGPRGYFGLITMLSRARCLLRPVDVAALRIAALAMHDRCAVETGLDHAHDGPQFLTRREIECLQMVAAGQSDRTISAALGISVSTVHFHIERAKKKLGARSRAEAVAILMQGGGL